MFLGHFAVAMAAKKAAPKVSLGTLVAGAQLADLLWPIFLLLGLEKVSIIPGLTRVTPLEFISYPYSHSLVALLLWGVVFGGGYFLLRPQFSRGDCAGIVRRVALAAGLHRAPSRYADNAAWCPGWPRAVEFYARNPDRGVYAFCSGNCSLRRHHPCQRP